MLTVWLIRTFTVDLAEHCAQAKSPDNGRVALIHPRRRLFGVGNATGLGMAPFLVKHPALVHQWVAARETALARVRALQIATSAAWERFLDALAAAKRNVDAWSTAEPIQAERIRVLNADLEALHTRSRQLHDVSAADLWDRIWLFAETKLSLECQELTAALLIEPHGELVDDLAETMAVDEEQSFPIDGRMTCEALLRLCRDHAGWAETIDFEQPDARARFWYASEEKLEPRLGERFLEPGAELELPIGTARDIRALHQALGNVSGELLLAEFLLIHAEHRHAVRRVQQTAARPYGEIRDNLIGSDMRPIDILRLKLAFFGAARFDPRSDRWLRITLFAGEPFPDELDLVRT